MQLGFAGKDMIKFIKSLFCKHDLSGGALFLGNPEMGYYCGKCGYFVYLNNPSGEPVNKKLFNSLKAILHHYSIGTDIYSVKTHIANARDAIAEAEEKMK